MVGQQSTNNDPQITIEDALRLAISPAEDIATASAGDIVSVTVDTRLRVTGVSIRAVHVPEDERLRIEQYIVEATNSAFSAAVRAWANQLKEVARNRHP